ncbi:MAG: DUF2264 domain-containing protein [Clostridia bacterium]|nr:DUF2264 domain-containing protein [Clostridia bacterium]
MLNTKKDFADCLKKIINPVKDYYTPGYAGIKLGSFGVSYSEEVAKMEAFCRILWGLAPLWRDGESAGEFDEIYAKGIANGTNPESDEYWGDIPSRSDDQKIVEMASLGLALILAPERVWYPLNVEEKANFHKWLSQVNCDIICGNNWQLFPLLVNLGFKNVGAPYDAERLKFCVQKCHSFYWDNGWYHDGKSDQADYYIPFAIHFYSLIYAKVMEKEDPENSRIFKERAKKFAQSFVYWFDEDGSALAFGRSLTYRFAQCCFFSACLFADVDPFPMGVIKGIISRHLEWWMSKPIFDNAGILSVGYAYPNLNMAEFYNAYGSPYWALKAFLFLALDENHEFFKAEALPLPKMSKMITIPEAYMTVQRVGGYSVALTGGQWANWGMTHTPEKYSKFAYSSRYAFNVSRTIDSMYNASPDSTLAFEIDDMICYRKKCTRHSMGADGSHYSRWSPYRGIEVETTLIPTDGGHIRRHTVSCDFDCVAYDTAFATPIGGGGEIHGGGEEVTLKCEPNSNLIFPRCEIKAVKYEFKKGVNTVETTVIYPKD